MKKTIITISIMLTTFYMSTAQLYIGANAGYNHTKFYNTSDAQADQRLDYVKTFKPMYGLDVGVKFKERLALGISPQLFIVGQHFKGQPATSTYINSFTANMQLNYVRVPLYLQIHMSSISSKVSQFLQFGPSVCYLLSSKETYIEVNNPVVTNDFSKGVQYTFTDKQLLTQATNIVGSIDSIRKYEYNLSKGLINRFDFGVNLGYGIKYKLSDKLNFNMLLSAMYGLANVENTDTINILDAKTGAIIGPYTIKDYRHSRYNPEWRSGDKPRSPKSNNIAIGIQFGLIYDLGGRKQK